MFLGSSKYVFFPAELRNVGRLYQCHSISFHLSLTLICLENYVIVSRDHVQMLPAVAANDKVMCFGGVICVSDWADARWITQIRVHHGVEILISHSLLWVSNTCTDNRLYKHLARLKGIVQPKKCKFCHYLLTLLSYPNTTTKINTIKNLSICVFQVFWKHKSSIFWFIFTLIYSNTVQSQ